MRVGVIGARLSGWLWILKTHPAYLASCCLKGSLTALSGTLGNSSDHLGQKDAGLYAAFTRCTQVRKGSDDNGF